MLNEILLGGGIATLSGVLGFLISKKINSANFDIYVVQAKAKAKAIENESEIILERSSLKSQEIELRAQKKYDETSEKVKQDFAKQKENLKKRENELEHFISQERETVERVRKQVDNSRLDVERQEKALDQLKTEYEKRIGDAIRVVESSAGLTQEESKQILLDQVREQSRADIAHIVRRYENEAKADGKRKANYILAQATSRFAGEFASERLINFVHLNDDELKGRIIGREGRNIKTLEMLLGVDIIIDETPNEIIVSSFNLYRRAIATRTLELKRSMSVSPERSAQHSMKRFL